MRESRKKFTALLIWLVTGQTTFTSQQCPLDPSRQWFVVQSPEPAAARRSKAGKESDPRSTQEPEDTLSRALSCIIHSFLLKKV